MDHKCCPVTKVAKLLVLVGGLNWGLIGLLQFNLVNKVLGFMPILERVVYGLVGVAAVFLTAMMIKCCCKKNVACETKKEGCCNAKPE